MSKCIRITISRIGEKPKHIRLPYAAKLDDAVNWAKELIRKEPLDIFTEGYATTLLFREEIDKVKYDNLSCRFRGLSVVQTERILRKAMEAPRTAFLGDKQ